MKRPFPTLALSLALASIASSQTGSFQGLGDLPGGGTLSYASALSPNGQWVVGLTQGPNGPEAFRWDAAGGLIGLGDFAGGSFYSQAFGVNSDGGTVCGVGSTADGQRAFLWSSATGMTEVQSGQPSGASRLNDISAAGGYVCGFETVWPGTPSAAQVALFAFDWLAYSQNSATPDTEARALAVSAFGDAFVGTEEIGGVDHAARWSYDPLPVLLEDTGFVSSAALSISTDGRLVVGHVDDGIRNVAAVWFDGVFATIDDSTGGFQTDHAIAVSGRGERIVGNAHDGTPWIYEMAMSSDPVTLRSMMETTYGIDLTGWTLSKVVDISGDGQYVTGSGLNPAGNVEAWLAYLPIACRADYNGDGVIDSVDLSAVPNGFAYGYLNGTAEGDYNGDGIVNGADVGAFAIDYNAGCPHTSGGSGGSSGGTTWIPHVVAGDPDDLGNGEG